MNISYSKKVLLTLVIMGLGFASCSKYDDGPFISLKTKTGRLTGNWELVNVQNFNINGTEDYFDFDIIGVSVEFDKGGDITRVVSVDLPDTSYSDTENGTWEWSDNKEGIDITWDETDTIPNDLTESFEVLRLKNKELWIKDADGIEWEFEKE